MILIGGLKLEKSKKNTINIKKIAVAIAAIIGIIYTLYVAALLHENENDTIFVEQGTIHKEETVVGYVIRNEVVIKGEGYQNGLVQIAGEGERVAKDEPIFQYYNVETKELTHKINELDANIQAALKLENITLTSNIKLIETQIEDNLKGLEEKEELSDEEKEKKEKQKTLADDRCPPMWEDLYYKRIRKSRI